MNTQPPIPTFDNLFKPVIQALKDLGGSGTVQEIYDKVCELEGFSEEQQAILHKDGPQTEIAYRMAWARTYLKKYGAIESIGRGVWALTSKGKELQDIDKKAIRRFVQQNSKPRSPSDEPSESAVDDHSEPETNDHLGESLELTQIPVDSEVWIDKLPMPHTALPLYPLSNPVKGLRTTAADRKGGCALSAVF